MINVEKTRTAICWLNKNGFENEVRDFIECVRSLNDFALKIEYSSDPNDWSSMLQRKCRKMQKIDTLYFSQKDEHIFRTFNATNKEDMLNWLQYINFVVNY